MAAPGVFDLIIRNMLLSTRRNRQQRSISRLFQPQNGIDRGFVIKIAFPSHNGSVLDVDLPQAVKVQSPFFTDVDFVSNRYFIRTFAGSGIGFVALFSELPEKLSLECLIPILAANDL